MVVVETWGRIASLSRSAILAEPMALEPGEVPADFLGRISAKSPQTPHNEPEATNDYRGETSVSMGLRGSGGWTRTNDLRLMKPPL